MFDKMDITLAKLPALNKLINLVANALMPQGEAGAFTDCWDEGPCQNYIYCSSDVGPILVLGSVGLVQCCSSWGGPVTCQCTGSRPNCNQYA